MNAVNAFINNGNGQNGAGNANRELIILNISHFCDILHFPNLIPPYRPWTDQEHQAFIQYLNNTLGQNLVQFTQNDPQNNGANNINLFEAPYSQVLRNGANGNQTRSRVAILYDGAMDQARANYLNNANLELPPGFFLISKYQIAQAANRLTLFDQYSNESDVAAMISKQYKRLTQRNDQAIAPPQLGINYPANAVVGVASTLHLLSWTCTYWIRSAITTITDRAAADVNPRLKRFFTRDVANPIPSWGYHPQFEPKINIIYIDHFASAQAANFPQNHPDHALAQMAMPVAIAAKLNKYGNDAQAWTGWEGW